MQLAKKLIEIGTLLLERYSKERSLISERLLFKINEEEIKKDKIEIEKNLLSLQNELFALESQSLTAFNKKEGKQISQLVNQKLARLLIKESLIRAELFFLKTKTLLNSALNGLVAYIWLIYATRPL